MGATHMCPTRPCSPLPTPIDAEVRTYRETLNGTRRVLPASHPSRCSSGAGSPHVTMLIAYGQQPRAVRRGEKYGAAPAWNWESPEMTNPHYVLLQASKLFMLLLASSGLR